MKHLSAEAASSGSSGPAASIAAKAGLAAGSQAAVVKLASYGSGSVRAASLLNYQSDKGQLTLEREDGTLVTGKAAVDDLAAHWREDDAREPSNDIFRVTFTFEGRLGPEEARLGLAFALDGHRYAWRLKERADSTLVHLVAVAAGARKDEHGKKERIYANAKSLLCFHDKIEDAFGRDVDLSAPVWAHGVEGATTQLAALTKAGALPAETDAGISLEEAANRRFAKQPSNANRLKPSNFNPALEIAKIWRPAMRSSSPRDFAHVILSAKPGTDKEAFMDAARATLAREFRGHEYVFVMHTNRRHIHVHAAVRLTSATGEKLHPGIQDFSRWRQTLAKEARERQIPMEAVRRFDQAHAPSYRLKDAKMVERGIAPESVRRRVERVQNREIHRPTREEGRRRAAEAASEWKSLAARRAAVLPPLAAGAMRLYRAESMKDGSHRAPLFSIDRALAEFYATKSGPSRLVYLDVPAERIAELLPSRELPARVFVVPPALNALRKPVDWIDEAAVLPFQRRVDAALVTRPQRPIVSKENEAMRTAQTMEAARRNMADAMARLGGYLPEGAVKDDLMRRSRDILARAEGATKEQERLERNPGQIEGDRFVEPQPRNVGALFTNEKKGTEIHYKRHDRETGAFQTLAFIDSGKQLDIRDWSNGESVNAALKLASQKWETLSVSGSDEYKETVARLAAENGYKITNPELQDRIRELRAKIETQRASISEGKERAEAKETDAPVKSAPLSEPEHQRPADPPVLNTTPAERAIELNSIRERVDVEAQRETRQAAHAREVLETNAAAGTERAPYRAPEEARAAREAERAVDNSPAREIPADPLQSEAIQALRFEQRRVLDQANRDEQKRIDAENAERFRQDERRDRDEAEGESM
ncbi:MULTISPECIES: LPD7 domain-containing protein [Methylocystis]|uniref:LPD7 domain-containing protein n=1 Tax=Methylocystis TaxID=133 RepID=UPI0024B913B3|nr:MULTISPECIES: LPD7 domain-containing protein [Methylocystis]MDJ0450975.1 relaxase/mobilization nuclease domain-containing protein [Methylocystis sp. JR02]